MGHAVIAVIIVDTMIVVVVVANNEVCYLTACRFGEFATIPIERARLSGALEIFQNGAANVLPTVTLVTIL